MRRPANPPPAPNAVSLHAAALTYLARFAATEAGLARVLARRVDRWARTAEGTPESITQAASQARAAIPALVARLAEAGAVSDAAFAGARARALAQAGRSRRAIGAKLAEKGVRPDLAGQVLPDDPAAELAAALIHARKRRMGPWRKAAASPELARRELGSYARAGFALPVAQRALKIPRDEAEALISAFRCNM